MIYTPKRKSMNIRSWKYLLALPYVLAVIWGVLAMQNLRLELQAVELQMRLTEIRRTNADLETVLNALREKQQQAVARPSVIGAASVYSENGCLGCDANLIMANGERLDDDRRTIAVACSYVEKRCALPFKFGQTVRVENGETGAAVVAVVTDTFGGIHGRVADLSLATATAINCKGICQVRIFKVSAVQ